MSRFWLALAFACAVLGVGAARADDWTADKLRGQVLQLVDGQWQPLGRGMVVPDSRVIRTLASGRVTFVRGGETVDVGPDTQIQIYDKGGRKPFTTVKQYFGSVSIEAEVEQVQHFAVQTPYLAAVVKGTRFTVSSGESGATVSVRRGHVAVRSYEDGSHATISVGQSAAVGAADGEVTVSGAGDLPAVLDAEGRPLASDVGEAQGRDKLGKSSDAKGGSDPSGRGKDELKSKSSDSTDSGSGNSGQGNSGSGKDDSGGSGKGDGRGGNG